MQRLKSTLRSSGWLQQSHDDAPGLLKSNQNSAVSFSASSTELAALRTADIRGTWRAVRFATISSQCSIKGTGIKNRNFEKVPEPSLLVEQTYQFGRPILFDSRLSSRSESELPVPKRPTPPRLFTIGWAVAVVVATAGWFYCIFEATWYFAGSFLQ
jgi:hypothetical protein